MLFVFFSYVGSEAGFGGWIFSYARLLDLIAEAPAAYLNSLFWGALNFGRLLAVPIARRVSSAGILQGSLIGCVWTLGLARSRYFRACTAAQPDDCAAGIVIC